MTPHEQPPTAKQLPLFVDTAAGEDVFVYVTTPDGFTWSVRKWSDGTEIFTRSEKGAARSEAEARGYIIKK